jgi:citrate lyase subunit beta/citryl-CoA lyase
LTAKDLEYAVVPGLDGIVLPKAESESQVTQISRMLEKNEKRKGIAPKSIKIIALIETAKGVVNSFQIASSNPRVIALAWGAGDYYRDLGRDITTVSENKIELLYAQSRVVNTSRAAGIQAIDSPFFGSLTDKEAFTKEVKFAVQLGFKGKQCIHPSQIETVNTFFSPTEEEITHARKIVKAFQHSRGAGVISFEGKMADIMTYRQAEAVLETARSMDETGSARKASFISIAEIFSQSRKASKRSH